jgi:zinc transport system ATP-binding protein
MAEHAHGAHGCDHDHGHSHHSHAATPAPLREGALLSARGITLARSGRSILDSVDLDIAPGEIVTLIGPNGAGKTTLVRVLLGLETPDRGEIHRRPGLTFGYAPQRFDRDPAIPMTVSRFLTLGAAATAETIARVLAEVGASRVAGQQLSRLSGGELQRVVLARALIRNPHLLVLDEPVRGVDYVGEAELYALIGRIRKERGLGVLLVSHDLHVVMAQSDLVVCLNRHVCCHGVPASVAQHPEYVRLFGSDVARSLAVYHHHHDHAHDLTGAPLPALADDAGSAGRKREGGGEGLT